MPWTQVYDPLGHWWLSTLMAALPIIVLFTLLAGLRVRPPLRACRSFDCPRNFGCRFSHACDPGLG